MRYIISFTLASAMAALTPAAAEVPRVVTDIPPIGSLVAQVMDDLGAPEVLLDKGADAHAFQMRPSQAGDLASAALVVWIGPEMTPWLERAMGGLANTGTDLRLLQVPGTQVLEFEEHDDHAAEAGDHDHGETDPHAWLSPANAGLWLDAIATRLSDIDPENAATYSANASKARAELASLDAELRDQLAPVKGMPIVVYHNAYSYFTGHYGLNLVGAIADGDAAAPGAAHLKELQSDLAATETCLFPEANHDPQLLTAVAEGTRTRIGAALDPEGAALPNGPELYTEMLRSMAKAISDCAKP